MIAFILERSHAHLNQDDIANAVPEAEPPRTDGQPDLCTSPLNPPAF